MKRKPKFEIRYPKSKTRGAAIMLALWALFLLAAMVISWALDIDARFSLSANANRRLEAVAMACSGAEVAMNPSIKPGSPNLRRQISDRRSYEARLTGEDGRLNINTLITLAAANNVSGCGQDVKLDVLCRYLTNRGIELNDLSVMIDSLLDWVAPGGGLHRLNAPPESENYHPSHTLFARLDELKKVKGWEEFTSNPGWDKDFTLNSSGSIDVTWASRDVLLALPGMSENAVDHFLELRRGPDGIDGTEDDMQRDSEHVRAALNLTPTSPQWQVLITGIPPLITFQSRFYRIVSIGKSGNAQRTVQLVFQRGTTAISVWREY